MPGGFFFRQSSTPIERTTQSPDRIRELIDMGFTFVGSQDWIPAPPTVTGTPPLIGGGPGGGIPSSIARLLIELGLTKLFPGPGTELVPQDPTTDPLAPVPGPSPWPSFLPRGAVPFITMPNGTTGCPSGYHPEKGDKPYCVRNRRMNSLNPRALSRASRRVGGFARAVKRARTLKKVCKSL